jgi:hypothetical protein
MQEDASDDVDQYNFSGWNIGGRNNKYGVRQARRSKPQQKPSKKVETTDQVQSKPTTKQMGGYPHPPGAISYAYAFTPYHQYQYQYPPPPPYGQMATVGGGGGYYGGYHHHGQSYGYPGQFPPPHHGNCCSATVTILMVWS